MLNGERIVLMTKLAAYEQGKGKKNMRISKYFRSDFLLLQLLKTFFYTTIAYVILVGLYMLYNLEVLTENLYEMDLFAFAQKILMIYAVFLIANCIITFIVYSYRYAKMKESMKEYTHNLKKLSTKQ